MNQQSTEHGQHAEHEVHLPDPSVWPLIVGLAALFVGLALTWWVRDRSNDFSGPILGAAVLSVFIAIAGWAYDDTKMRRKALEGGASVGPREARFTQVVTFAVPEGQLPHARSEGIISAVERADNHLRDLAGFQDLRIIVSPSESGPSQVLVETTWSNREGLATYEETRQTMLDLVANNPDDVVPGSTQVFDMEVVRDTKEMAFRFGLAPAFAVFGALIAGGLVFGAALSAFQNETPVRSGAPGTETPATGGLTLIATDNKFDKSTITVPPNTEISLDFKNNGQVKHNVHFLTKEGGDTLAPGAEGAILDGGKSETLTFTTPAAGNYYFQCDLHPDQMKGVLEVKEGAPNPSAGGNGGAAAPAGAVKVIATDNKFDKTSIDGTAGKEIEVDLENQGKVPHNIHFYDKAGGNTLAQGAEGAILPAGKSEAIKFTPPNAGTFYFQCDLHPDQMNGKFVVK